MTRPAITMRCGGLLLLALASCTRASEQGFLDAEYVVEGTPVRLRGGLSETHAAPGSAAKVRTRYYGHDLEHDLDGDGRIDVVFLLKRETGGSGVFFYVVAALDRPDRWIGSQGMLLGDRIAPRSVALGTQGEIVIEYADRVAGEPFSAAPSHARRLRLHFDPGRLQFRPWPPDPEDRAEPPGSSGSSASREGSCRVVAVSTPRAGGAR